MQASIPLTNFETVTLIGDFGAHHVSDIPLFGVSLPRIGTLLVKAVYIDLSILFSLLFNKSNVHEVLARPLLLWMHVTKNVE